MVISICLACLSAASIAESALGLELPTNAMHALERRFPGYAISQVSSGELFESESEAFAVMLYKAPENQAAWPTFIVAVVGPSKANGLAVITSTCEDTFNPKDGLSLTIKNRSLFIGSTNSGMDSSSSTELQYKYDGKGLALVAEESRSFYHGDDPHLQDVSDVRRSTNYVTGRVIEYGSKGIAESKIERIRPGYFGCDSGAAYEAK